MIKTAKMQGNVMVSLGGEARGRERPRGGAVVVGGVLSPRVPSRRADRDPWPRAAAPPPLPTGAHRRPPGYRGAGACLHIATLRCRRPSPSGVGLGARGGCARRGRGGGRAAVRVPGGPPGAVLGGGGQRRSRRPGEGPGP